MLHDNPMLKLSYIIILAVFIAGCGAPGTIKSDETISEMELQAEQQLLTGNFTAASELFLLLADKNTLRSELYKLKAVDSLLQANDIDRAKSVFADINFEKLDAQEQIFNKILLGRIALLENNPLAAIEIVSEDLPPDTPSNIAILFYQLQSDAYEKGDQLIEALNGRISLGRFIDNTDEFRINNDHIWRLLSRISHQELEQQRALSTGEKAGWIELSIIARTKLFNRQQLENSLYLWREQFPAHTAELQIIPEIFAQADKIDFMPDKIALFLPFNEQHESVSQAIINGFLAAWYETSGDKPEIKIYDTAGQDINIIYQRAVNDGVNFIVGPLTKEAVMALERTRELPVKVLALNQVTGNTAKPLNPHPQNLLPSIFQFGLLPEDEALFVAERAWFNGNAHALVITPDTDWGQRIFTAFRNHFQQLGGQVLEHVTLSNLSQDYSAPVKTLLNIDLSEQREKELTSILRRKIHAEPRRRNDADLIFIAATPVIARQLIPQLRYYRADDIPMYSISSVYSGIQNQEADNDLNNVIFVDMPWVINPGNEYSPLQQSLNKSWNQSESTFRRLYAFGVDAYRIIPHLVDLYFQNKEYQGETGLLRITPEGHIKRKPVWSKFINGLPQLLDTQQLNYSVN